MENQRLEHIQSFTGKQFTGSPSSFAHWLKRNVISAEEKSVAFQFMVRTDILLRRRTNIQQRVWQNTVRQALFVIYNFKKRHTSKKQVTETKKISRRELIKQGGLVLSVLALPFPLTPFSNFKRNDR